MKTNEKQPLSRLMRKLIKEMHQLIVTASEHCGLEKLANQEDNNGGNIALSERKRIEILKDVTSHIGPIRKKITVATKLRCDEEIRTVFDNLDIQLYGVQGHLASDYLQALNLLNEAKDQFDIFRRSRR